MAAPGPLGRLGVRKEEMSFMTRRKKLAASMIVLGVIGGTIMPSAAFAECPNFPTVSWWGKVSHDSVTSYVARKYDGDWTSYVKKWERQLSRMTKVRDRGKTAVIKSRNLRLSGDKLSIYVEQIRQRVAVTRCLAHDTTEAASFKAASRDGRS
jgi:hypothetical protein